MAAFLWGGCAEQNSGTPSPQKKESNATVLSVMAMTYTPGTQPLGIGEPLKGMQEVADAWEELHPGVRVRFALPPTMGTVDSEWIKTQLLGGIAPDIVHMNAEVVWEDIDKGWWLNLEPYLAEPNPYIPGNKQWLDIFANQSLTMAKRAPDGNSYTIVYDMIETGLFINKEMLKKYNLSPPKTWGEMRTINQHLRKADVIPLVLATEQVSDWAVDIILDMVYADIIPLIDIVKASEEQEAYLQGYLYPEEVCRLYKKGWFTDRDPRWREVWRILLEWRKDWQHDYVADDRAMYFLSKRSYSYWDSSGFLPRILNDPLVDFDWAITYLPPLTPEDCPYAIGAEAPVIGGAGIQFSVTSSAIQNSKEELAIDFLRFLTTPENAARVINEAGQMIPNIAGTPMQSQLQPFSDIIQRHYCLVKFLFTFDTHFQNEHRRWVHYYLEGGESLDSFLDRLTDYLGRAVDRYAERAGLDLSEPYNVPSPWELEDKQT